MSAELADLERRALDLMKRADFGDDAVRINTDILALDPSREAAWTRLGRCHLEGRRFDEAIEALRSALALNPSNAIATRLLAEVRKQRALTPTARERATTGFSTREFAMLESLAPAEAATALTPRVDALLDSVNATSIAARIVEARRREGQTASKLFHANSCHPGGAGHIYAYHYGGRWEPQFNLGWFSSPPFPSNCVRIGIGFNCSRAGLDPDRASGLERVVAYFERFQRVLERAWKRELARWMAASGGFVQFGDKPPATDLLPDKAVEVLLTANAASVDWLFVGRWLFFDRADDARILAERPRLASAVDETFRTLFPLWLGAYTDLSSPSG